MTTGQETCQEAYQDALSYVSFAQPWMPHPGLRLECKFVYDVDGIFVRNRMDAFFRRAQRAENSCQHCQRMNAIRPEGMPELPCVRSAYFMSCAMCELLHIPYQWCGLPPWHAPTERPAAGRKSGSSTPYRSSSRNDFAMHTRDRQISSQRRSSAAESKSTNDRNMLNTRESAEDTMNLSSDEKAVSSTVSLSYTRSRKSTTTLAVSTCACDKLTRELEEERERARELRDTVARLATERNAHNMAKAKSEKMYDESEKRCEALAQEKDANDEKHASRIRRLEEQKLDVEAKLACRERMAAAWLKKAKETGGQHSLCQLTEEVEELKAKVRLKDEMARRRCEYIEQIEQDNRSLRRQLEERKKPG